MLRLMGGLKVDMHIRPLDIRQRLELHLQLLGDIVSGTERLVGVHDDVDLDEETRAGGVGADGVDGGDHWGVGHCCCMLVPA